MKIGTVEVPSQLVLAPMAGVTDLAFRLICRELGAGLTVTEMVSAKALCYQDKKSRGLLKLSPGEHPASAQIFGSDPVCMQEGAAIAPAWRKPPAWPPSCPAPTSSTSTWAVPWARWSPTVTAPP